MKTMLLILISVVLCVYSKYDAQQCPENQVRIECRSVCPSTCENGPSTCGAVVCDNGCACSNNLWLYEKTGKCMTQKECESHVSPKENKLLSSVCPKNQVRTKCRSACPSTCENGPSACDTVVCDNGCGCSNNLWLYEKTGKCMTQEECKVVEGKSNLEDGEKKLPSVRCPSNLVWKQCVSVCPNSCLNGRSKCNQLICGGGCECDAEKWYDEKTTSCVKSKKQCTPKENIAEIKSKNFIRDQFEAKRKL